MILEKEKIWVLDRNRTHDLRNTGRALQVVIGRSWVQFLSGFQIFSLFHARVMLINSFSHFITELKLLHLYSLICLVHLHGFNLNLSKLFTNTSREVLVILKLSFPVLCLFSWNSLQFTKSMWLPWYMILWAHGQIFPSQTHLHMYMSTPKQFSKQSSFVRL